MSDDAEQKWEELDKRLSDIESNILSFNENVAALAAGVARVEKILDDATQEGELKLSTYGEEEDEDDELYEKAKELVVKAGQASTSYLQRRLGIGYSRAARLLDKLEEDGVIGPADGVGFRKALLE
jgi:DNA segregation ATPase FtsK/SpoIIIE-like protein